jgi:hypothetical protein
MQTSPTARDLLDEGRGSGGEEHHVTLTSTPNSSYSVNILGGHQRLGLHMDVGQSSHHRGS